MKDTRELGQWSHQEANSTQKNRNKSGTYFYIHYALECLNIKHQRVNLIEIHRFYPNDVLEVQEIKPFASRIQSEHFARWIIVVFMMEINLILVEICDCLTLQIAISYMIHSVWLTSIHESSHHNSTKEWLLSKEDKRITLQQINKTHTRVVIILF